MIARSLSLFGLVDVGRRIGTPEHTFGRLTGTQHGPAALSSRRKGKGGRRDKKDKAPDTTGYAIRLSTVGKKLLGRPVPEAPEGLVVGADFEVMAPLDRVSPEVLLRLGLYGSALDGHPTDPVRRFKIERSAVQEALPLVSHEVLTQDLQRAAGGIPANVATTVDDWCKGFGEIQIFFDRDLLEFSSKRQRDRALSEYSEAQAVGDRYALLAKDCRSRLDVVHAVPDAPFLQPHNVVDLAQKREARQKKSKQSSTKGTSFHLIDYDGFPPPFLNVLPDLSVEVNHQRTDLLFETEFARFTTAHKTSTQKSSKKKTQKSLYRLDRDRVASSGQRAEHILKWLEARSKGPLPQHLPLVLQGWTGKGPVLALSQATLLQTPTPEAADALVSMPQLKDCLLGRFGECILQVDPKALGLVKKMLKEMGLASTADLSPYPLAGYYYEEDDAYFDDDDSYLDREMERGLLDRYRGTEFSPGELLDSLQVLKRGGKVQVETAKMLRTLMPFLGDLEDEEDF